MKERLEIEIATLNEELQEAEKKFNERINKNPIGSTVYNQSMDSLLCLGATPCESARNFYGNYSGLFSYAKAYKASHPEDGKAVVNAHLEKFCVEDEAIRGYLTAHLYIPSQDNYALFAHAVVDVHNTLVNLGFDEIITVEQLLQSKKEQLASLEEETPDVMLPNFDAQLERIGDATRSLVNKGARKLLKLATYVKDRTDKK